MEETKTNKETPQVDVSRRRLTKAGLVAPAVLGTLASRQVLGAAPYNCTISGMQSGNVSSHGEPVSCATLGSSPATYLAAWPLDSDFYVHNAIHQNVAGARNFQGSPKSAPTHFANAYRAHTISPSDNRTATVLEVLLGYVPTYDNNWGYSPIADTNVQLQVRSGFTDSGFALGQEAIAAYLNAADQTKYPITQSDVVAMFNAVIVTGGIYDPLGANWNASQVLAYFKSLHP